MAAAGQAPRIDLRAGVTALDEDLPKVLGHLGVASMEALGWSRPEKLVLLVPMKATHEGQTDHFLLRLGFQAYREWPPSAQFVNPETTAYAGLEDRQHLPKLNSPECNMHWNYPRPGGGSMQLICCSATLEFYEVLHGVQPEHLWADHYTFLTTLKAIQRAMESFYQGRFTHD